MIQKTCLEIPSPVHLGGFQDTLQAATMRGTTDIYGARYLAQTCSGAALSGRAYFHWRSACDTGVRSLDTAAVGMPWFVAACCENCFPGYKTRRVLTMLRHIPHLKMCAFMSVLHMVITVPGLHMLSLNYVQDMLVEFLGRAPTDEAFLRSKGLS